MGYRVNKQADEKRLATTKSPKEIEKLLFHGKVHDGAVAAIQSEGMGAAFLDQIDKDRHDERFIVIMLNLSS